MSFTFVYDGRLIFFPFFHLFNKIKYTENTGNIDVVPHLGARVNDEEEGKTKYNVVWEKNKLLQETKSARIANEQK